ncbi:Actin-like protein 6A [Trichoplax sp. H2]|uniref:Actin-like protein 6A n=1 Tax=Trichoplax adhaerens TaxID=10228 RepID=B3S5L8_TRIAD|nr:hypothetical protein TRIADDRAFT_29808 [Trichoplax adhaerens]EDV21979.1 hypothetical protein TRIADDRAFT_29808 [Trichoplax adhaerens]RDD39771.1 Actin-like protein 6A [Trichoplax sp. H2]|eukprot:XP_002115616.1 hypothetical protein TRIADDRAFT_29808 [Trichoplax adhaerens]
MSGGVYGGDEVGAIVLDIGNTTVRAGFAGEDTPKADFPSYVGCTTDGNFEDDNAMDTADGPTSVASKRKYYIGYNFLSSPKERMEMISPLKDGMIDDWDLFKELFDHTFANHIRSDPSVHPILMTEPAWNERGKREKLCELMFETYNVPAFYLCKSPVLAGFANGRYTGIILDSGAHHTSAIPIYDGYVLQQGIVKSPLGGDFVTAQCRSYLADKNVEIVPTYLVGSKTPVGKGEPSIYTKRANLPAKITQSYHNYMVKNTLHDFKASVLEVLDSNFHEINAGSIPSMHYEFPDGYNNSYGVDRFKLAEGLFDPSTVKGMDCTNLLGISQLILTSVGICDIDIRPNLYSSVVVTGGNSLLRGFCDRLSRELQNKVPPGLRTKVVSANGSLERRCGAWIGGSILASLGSFQQMWISKQEYDDGGKNCVERKCP